MGFTVSFGISDNTVKPVDNRLAGHLGYHPKDNTERFRAAMEARTDTPDPRAPAVRALGGWFVDIGHPDDPADDVRDQADHAGEGAQPAQMALDERTGEAVQGVLVVHPALPQPGQGQDGQLRQDVGRDDQIRAALKYFKENWKEARAPRLAFLYPNAPYGLAPIPAGKEYARELGFEIVGEENVDLKAIDATTQLLALKDKNPDFTWIGGTTPSTAVIMKDAKKLGMKTTFFVNIWGADESLVQLAGDAAEGAYSLQAAAVYGQDVPGMKAILEQTKGRPQMTHFTRGWVSMMVMAEGMRLALAQGPLTGETLKAALETLRDFDPQGLAPRIGFLANDHRPNTAVFLYRVQNGKLAFVASQNLERKADWLGK